MSALGRWLLAVLGGLVLVAPPVVFFLLAIWHARSLDLGERYGWTGGLLLAATPILLLAVGFFRDIQRGDL